MGELLVDAHGLLLLALRATPLMAVLLAVRLALTAGLFIATPYGSPPDRRWARPSWFPGLNNDEPHTIGPHSVVILGPRLKRYMAESEVNARRQQNMSRPIDPMTDPATGFHQQLDEVFHLDRPLPQRQVRRPEALRRSADCRLAARCHAGG